MASPIVMKKGDLKGEGMEKRIEIVLKDTVLMHSRSKPKLLPTYLYALSPSRVRVKFLMWHDLS